LLGMSAGTRGCGWCVPRWSLYSGLKAEPLPHRPVRPDPDATTEQLEQSYPDILALLIAREAASDPLRQATYAWEESCLHQGPLISVIEAQSWLWSMWAKYSKRHRPAFTAPPQLIVEPNRRGAVMKTLQHRIVLAEGCVRRPWIAHEIGHALNPHEHHGPDWAETMITIWAEEFDIPRSRSLALARQHGVSVGAL